MDKEQVRQIVNETVDRLFEGGPGSGRYPAGSGKHPTTEDNVTRLSGKSLDDEINSASSLLMKTMSLKIEGMRLVNESFPFSNKKNDVAKDFSKNSDQSFTYTTTSKEEQNIISALRRNGYEQHASMATKDKFVDYIDEKSTYFSKGKMSIKIAKVNQNREDDLRVTFKHDDIRLPGENEAAIKASARGKEREAAFKDWQAKVDRDEKNQTPEERTRRTKNLTRFLARKYRDNHPDW